MGCTHGSGIAAVKSPAKRVDSSPRGSPESLSWRDDLSCDDSVMSHVVEDATLPEVTGATIEMRAERVSKCFEHMFKEDRMMKNLLCQVGSMVHASLTRHCAAEQHEALAMFKTRVMLQYWRSGKDDKLGGTVPKTFIDSFAKLLSIVQHKAASKGQLSPDQHPLLLQVSLFFQDGYDAEEEVQKKEFKETMQFLSAFFDMLQQLHAYMEPQHKGKQAKASRSVGLSKFCQRFTADEVKQLMESVGCVHMAMKLSLLTGGEPMRRPAFIGMESIGKSSLINYLVDGTHKDLLPTGESKETEGVALVQHGEPARLMFDDESTESSMTEGVRNSMKAVAKKLKKHKDDAAISLDTPLLRVIAPFRAGAGRIEYLDVPGIRDNTKLDVSLALGCCSLIVLCVNSPMAFEASFNSETGLGAFARMYNELTTKPHILLAVTLPFQTDKVMYDPETFEITAPANFKDDFKKLMDEKFPDCPGHKLMFADTVSMRPRTQLGQDFVNRFLHEVNSFGAPTALDPAEQLVVLKDQVVKFAAVMEEALIKNFESDKFDELFEEARNSAANALTSFRHIADAQREWNIGVPLTNPMKEYTERVKHLDRFTAMGFPGEHHVDEVQQGEIKLQSDILQQSRCVLMKSVKENGVKAYQQVWQCMEHFPQLYLNGDTFTKFAPEGTGFQEVLKTHIDIKSTEFAECVAIASNTKIGRSWPEPLKEGVPDPEVLAADYRKWFQKSACELRGFADMKRFPWYLNGYYAAMADAHQKAAFLGKSGNAKILKLDSGDYVSKDMVGPSAVAKFPDCTGKLNEFDSKVQEWISRIKRTEQKPEAAESSHLRDREIIACCLDAAKEAKEALEGSNVIEGNNPLVTKLVDLAFAMIERLMVVYDKDGHDHNRYQWTKFADMLLNETGKGSSLDQARFCKSQLVGSADVQSIKTVAEIQELVCAMNTARTILENDSGAVGRSGAHGEMAVLTEELSDELSNLEAVKMSVLQSLTGPEPEQKVLVASVNKSYDIDDVVKDVKAEFSASFVVGKGIGNWDTVLQTLEREQPPIAFIIRGAEVMSSEPQDDELKCLTKLRNAAFLGVIIVCSQREISTQRWTRESGIECRHMPITLPAYGQSKITVPSGALAKVMGGDGDDLFASVEKLLAARGTSHKAAFGKMKSTTIDALDKFMRMKSTAQRIGPEDFYKNLIKNKQIRHHPVDFKEKLRICLPSVQTFYQDPFLEQITEEGLQRVQELQIRQFLQSIISSQLMEYGKKLADALYSHTIEKMIAILITDRFGIKPEKFTHLLAQYVNSKETSDGDGLERRKDDHIPAEFLSKQNFVSMYVGGTVLATCPMLYAMVGARLMTTGSSQGEPTSQYYAENLKVAKGHYRRLREVGNLIEDVEKQSVGPLSARSSVASSCEKNSNISLASTRAS